MEIKIPEISNDKEKIIDFVAFLESNGYKYEVYKEIGINPIINEIYTKEMNIKIIFDK